jgi:tetratricopeptide (TPR) repeat protein
VHVTDTDGRGESARVVGRERELEALRAGLADARSGAGRLYVVSGEPGVGKTTLAETIAAEAESLDARALWGRCWEDAGAPPYWPWIQILRAHARELEPDALRTELADGAPAIAALVPETRAKLPDVPEPQGTNTEGARFALFEAVAGTLRRASERRPHVLVLDDLHAADTPSLLLLRFVARDLQAARLLIVVTYREVEARLDSERARLLADVGREGQTISLTGLSETELSELVRDRAGVSPAEGLARELYRKTEGNPFFADEVIRVLIAEGRLAVDAAPGIALPDGVRETIARRFEHLSEPARDLLAIASVIGREFDLDVLARVRDQRPAELIDALDEAVDLSILEELPGPATRYAFAHALFREALYDGLRKRERMSLHRRVGEALEADAAEAHPAELAHHFFQAAAAGEGVEKAVGYATAAGDHADARFAYEEATEHYRRALAALDWLEPRDDTRRCELLLAMGDTQWRAAATEPAKRTFEEASAAARRLGSAEHLARAALGFGGRFAWVEATGAVDQRLADLLDQALTLLGDDGDPALRARLKGRLAMQLYFSERRYPEAQRAAAEAVELARGSGDRAALAYALNARRFVLWGRSVTQERVTLSRELLAVATEAGETELVLRGHGWLIVDQLESGEIAGADRAIDLHVQMANELRQPLYAAEATKFHAMRALMDGRLVEAERLIEDFASTAARMEDPDVAQAIGIQLFVLRGLQGRLTELEEGARAFAEQYPLLPAWRCGLAFLCGEVGKEDEARRRYRALTGEHFGWTNRAGGWLIGICTLTELCAQFDDTDGAPKLYATLDPFSGTNVVIGYGAACFGAADRPLGVLASVLGQFDRAEEHFRAALDLETRMAMPVFAAWTRTHYAAMLLARDGEGDFERAAELLEAALEATRAAGADRLTRIAEWLLAAGGGVRGSRFGAIAGSHFAIARGEAPPEPEAPAAEKAAPARVLFVREGEYWTIGDERSPFRLKDAKGLHYVAKLLAAPDMEWHAADLVSDGHAPAAPAGLTRDEATTTPGLGDAGAILDQHAKAAYRERIEDLREDLAEAESFGDVERASRAREELDFVAAELAGAVGLRGRDRKAASASERARVNATRTIKSAIRRIAENDEELGRHLEHAVRTGTFCSYAPEPRARVDWKLEA